MQSGEPRSRESIKEVIAELGRRLCQKRMSSMFIGWF